MLQISRVVRLVLPGRLALRQASARGAAAGAGASRDELRNLVKELHTRETVPEEEVEARKQRLEDASPQLQSNLIQGEMNDRLSLLKDLADLGLVPGKPYPFAALLLAFLEEYIKGIEALRDGETTSQRAEELRKILLCFHRAGLAPDRLKLLYGHIENDFPRFEAVGAILPMPKAVLLCHTMLSTGLSTAGAVAVLLRAALREPLIEVADDAQELRLLKTIEMLIRVDFLHTQEQLPPEVAEYLSLVRNLRFYDRELRRDTALSYQLAFFLRKHGFPAKRKMLGPYPLKVCDPLERINFEPLEERPFRAGLLELPLARKKRHLEAVGWRSIEVQAGQWKSLPGYEAKAAFIRKLLQENELLTV